MKFDVWCFQLAPMNSTRLFTTALCCALVLLNGCGKNDSAPAGGAQTKPGKKPKIAYITNGVDPFWNTAAAGVKAAAKEFDADAEVHMPAKGIGDQKRIVESLLAAGVDGIAISPIDARSEERRVGKECCR